MARLSEKQKENRIVSISDTKVSISKREKAYKEIVKDFMNPDENFNPETFDYKRDTIGYDVKKRNREAPAKRLPTMGLKPKKILEGQMVGMFESKQDLYLLIAALYDRVADLEEWRDSI